MSERTVQSDFKDGILKVSLHRPESLNAMNAQMLQDLKAVFLEAHAAKDLRAVIFTGTGKVFCSGGDVKFFYEVLQKEDARAKFHDMPNQLHDFTLLMQTLPVPVLGAVNGPAVGVGFSYALACDILVASQSAYFMLGYLKIGLSPDGGSTYFLPRAVGVHKALASLALAEKISAEEAKRLGFVQQVFSDDSFEEEVYKVARNLAALPTKAYAEAKRLMFSSHSKTLAEQLHLETEAVKRSSQTRDFYEGVKAFSEKKKPSFQGQ